MLYDMTLKQKINDMKVSMICKIMNISKSIVGLLLRGLRPCGAALALTLMLVGLPVSTQAEDRLAQIFQDNMVLQREKPVPVWGWANPGAQVEVAFGGQKKQAKADAKGYWKAILDPMPASRDGRTLEVRIGGTALSRKNVLVGEVWMATGQSNMVAGGPDFDNGVYPHYVSPGTKGGKPEIRICDFGFGASLEPMEDIDVAGRGAAPWKVLNENPLPTTMGPSYYFARVVRDGVDVPVGIIVVAVPGTNQAAWIEKKTLESFPALEKKGNFYEEWLASREAELAKSNGPLKSWEDLKKADAAWRVTKKGRWPGNEYSSAIMGFCQFPSALYNTRIHPLAPFALRGAIWHQGEAGPGGPYGERLAAMAKQWRALFGQDFTFIWGTLARITNEPPPLTPLCSSFYRSKLNPSIHQALKVFGNDKNVALVELYDLGNWGTHFSQKGEMGKRMGQAALNVAYGQNHLYAGPRMVETKIEGRKAIVRFEQVGDGIVHQPSIDGISGVFLRGKNGTVRWGQVKVLGKDTVEFSHPDIADLETVAYAENPNPHETLFNSAGLPASPFTVNPSKNSDPQPSVQLLTLEGKDGVIMSLCHVRRSGYVFQLLPKNAKAPSVPITVQAYIPSEWKGFEVEVVARLEYLDAQLTPSERKGFDLKAGGKRLESTETNKDGKRFATIKVPADGSWIIVSEVGWAADFRKVNRF